MIKDTDLDRLRSLVPRWLEMVDSWSEGSELGKTRSWGLELAAYELSAALSSLRLGDEMQPTRRDRFSAMQRAAYPFLTAEGEPR